MSDWSLSADGRAAYLDPPDAHPNAHPSATIRMHMLTRCLVTSIPSHPTDLAARTGCRKRGLAYTPADMAHSTKIDQNAY